MKHNKNKNNPIELLKRFWDFVWNGESLMSWIVFIILAFVIIRFIFFPGLSLITGTELPLVIVESCSMYHDNRNFDLWWLDNGEWYLENEIEKSVFEGFSLKNGFSKGDIFLVTGASMDSIELGDTIIFASGRSQRPIIHRVVGLDPLETKGDNNARQFSANNNPDRIDETDIQEEQLIGKATSVRLPFLGWIKLVFFEPFRAESERGFCK